MKIIQLLITLVFFSSLVEARNWETFTIDPDFVAANEMRITAQSHPGTCKGVLFLEVFGYPMEYKGNKLKSVAFRVLEKEIIINEFYLEYDVKSIVSCVTKDQLLAGELEFLYMGKSQSKVLLVNDFTPFIE